MAREQGGGALNVDLGCNPLAPLPLSVDGLTDVVESVDMAKVSRLSLKGRSVWAPDDWARVVDITAERCATLRELDVSFTQAGNDVALKLVDIASAKHAHARGCARSHIHSLNLAYCGVGVTATPAMARALESVSSRLRSLILRYNAITAQGLGLLLKWAINIAHIDCRFCGILTHPARRETNLAFILEGMRENTTCTHLQLEGNGFNQVEQQRIFEEVAHNKRSAFAPGCITFANPKLEHVFRKCTALAAYLEAADAHNTELAMTSGLTPDGDLTAWAGRDFTELPAAQQAEVLADAVLLEQYCTASDLPITENSSPRASGGSPQMVDVPLTKQLVAAAQPALAADHAPGAPPATHTTDVAAGMPSRTQCYTAMSSVSVSQQSDTSSPRMRASVGAAWGAAAPTANDGLRPPVGSGGGGIRERLGRDVRGGGGGVSVEVHDPLPEAGVGGRGVGYGYGDDEDGGVDDGASGGGVPSEMQGTPSGYAPYPIPLPRATQAVVVPASTPTPRRVAGGSVFTPGGASGRHTPARVYSGHRHSVRGAPALRRDVDVRQGFPPSGGPPTTGFAGAHSTHRVSTPSLAHGAESEPPSVGGHDAGGPGSASRETSAEPTAAAAADAPTQHPQRPHHPAPRLKDTAYSDQELSMRRHVPHTPGGAYGEAVPPLRRRSAGADPVTTDAPAPAARNPYAHGPAVRDADATSTAGSADVLNAAAPVASLSSHLDSLPTPLPLPPPASARGRAPSADSGAVAATTPSDLVSSPRPRAARSGAAGMPAHSPLTLPNTSLWRRAGEGGPPSDAHGHVGVRPPPHTPAVPYASMTPGSRAATAAAADKGTATPKRAASAGRAKKQRSASAARGERASATPARGSGSAGGGSSARRASSRSARPAAASPARSRRSRSTPVRRKQTRGLAEDEEEPAPRGRPPPPQPKHREGARSLPTTVAVAGGGGGSSKRDRTTPALLNACMAGNRVCQSILVPDLFHALPAEAGKLQGVPKPLVPCCGLPDVLNQLRLGSDERVTGIAKLLYVLLSAPCNVEATEEHEILEKAALLVAKNADTTYECICRRDDYNEKRREENRKARALLKALRKSECYIDPGPPPPELGEDVLPHTPWARSPAADPPRRRASPSTTRGAARGRRPSGDDRESEGDAAAIKSRPAPRSSSAPRRTPSTAGTDAWTPAHPTPRLLFTPLRSRSQPRPPSGRHIYTERV